MPRMPHLSEFSSEQTEILDTCAWCEGRQRNQLFHENGFPYYQCRSCSIIYLGVRPKEEFVSLIYDDQDYHAASNVAYLKRTGEKRLDLLGQLRPGARIFEDGAGAGGFLAACQARGYEATGCDLGSDAVYKAKSLFDVDLHHGTMASLELPDSSLDVIASFNLLSHLYAPWDYFQEVYRVLKDDGIFFIRTGLRDGLMKYVRRGQWSAPEHVFHYTRKVINRLLNDAGMTMDRVIPAFDSDFPYFLYDFSRDQSSAIRRGARRICGYTILAWTLLRLPKDDVFIIARKNAPRAEGSRR